MSVARVLFCCTNAPTMGHSHGQMSCQNQTSFDGPSYPASGEDSTTNKCTRVRFFCSYSRACGLTRAARRGISQARTRARGRTSPPRDVHYAYSPVYDKYDDGMDVAPGATSPALSPAQTDSSSTGAALPSMAHVPTGDARHIFWSDIRPDKDVASAANAPTELTASLATATLERNWGQRDVHTVIGLMKQAAEHPADARDLPSGQTFVRKIDDFLPEWQRNMAHKTETFTVDDFEYTVAYWDPTVYLGILLSQPEFQENGVFKFKRRDVDGQRVYDEAWECRRFEGLIVQEV